MGPYEIVAPIGAGGMGEVYRAYDTRLGRTVAIKISKEPLPARLEREARAVAALNHPHICTLYDVGPDYLVMEYIEGAPLRGPLTIDLALKYGVQICDALDAAHKKGITHRDLKPANILVTTSGVKLLDFGLAHVEPVSPSGADATRAALVTQAGMLLGTAAYMSPEQAEGRTVDARSDIFSLGVVLYEMISGRRAFEAGSFAATLGAVIHSEPAALDAPPAVRTIVSRCLRKSPADRFQSASDLRAAIVAAGAARIADDGPSIAVLPFANTSADKENDYFSDGLTEEIINALTHIPGLKVIARTSAFAFRGKEQDIRTIAEALGVRTVLEGSVRRAGNRIRVTTQLINADDGSHLWSERYDREMEDVFAIQDQIATALAAALETKFVVQADASRPHTPVLDAYHAVLRARHYLSKLTRKSMPQARECLRGAIALDPGYALPHSVLGGSFVTPAIFGMIPAHEAMPPARAAYQKALEIDPMLSEALVGLAAISMLYDYDWPAASGLFARAMTRGPLVGGARATYGQFLYFTGQAEAALQEHQQAVLGDPLNLTLRSMLAWALMIAGRIDEAASECRRILELNDRYSVGSFQLGLTQAACGDFQAALESAEKAHTATPWSLAVSGFTAGLLTLTGNPQRAEIVGQALGNGMVYGAPLGFVHYHLVRSEAELAAKWVEKAIEQRDPMLLFVLKAPLGAPLRQSAAWASLSATLFG